MTRLTFDAASDFFSLWTPDGQRVVFSSTRDGGFENLYWRAADGTGQAERLTKSPNKQTPYSFSPDGKQLAFTERDPETGRDLYVLSMEGEFTSEPLLQTPFHERAPAISPDGRWMAYSSNESGPYQVYVRPFPNVEDGKWQVSTGGGGGGGGYFACLGRPGAGTVLSQRRSDDGSRRRTRAHLLKRKSRDPVHGNVLFGRQPKLRYFTGRSTVSDDQGCRADRRGIRTGGSDRCPQLVRGIEASRPNQLT